MSTLTVTRLDAQLSQIAEELETSPDAAASAVVSQHRDYHRDLAKFSGQLDEVVKTAEQIVDARAELEARLQRAEALGVDFSHIEDGKIGGVPVTQFAHVNRHEATAAKAAVQGPRPFATESGQRALLQATNYLKILADGPKTPAERGAENSRGDGPNRS